ncbi:hypothetical protein JCM8097_003420 [Rhodosporidiobolus ruineniae]
MNSDTTGSVISDSEPDYPASSAASTGGFGGIGSAFLAKAMRDAQKREREQRATTSAAREKAVKPKEEKKPQRDQDEVLVLSSSDDEADSPPQKTSRHFAFTSTSTTTTTTKRRRVPPTTPAGAGWPDLAAPGSPSSPPCQSHSHQHISTSPDGTEAKTSGPALSLDPSTSRGAPVPAGSPFVSALELLKSTPSTQAGSDGEVEEEEVKPKKGKGKKEKKAPSKPRRIPTVKKSATAGVKRRSPSVSSVEIVDSEEDDRMSVASSASSSSGLPPPSSWKERFQFGAKSSTESLTLNDEDDKPLPPPSSTAGASRKKPWEALESTFANRPKVKPPPSKAKKATIKKVVKAESRSSGLEDDSDDAVIVVGGASASASTSTAFLPLPAARSSRSSSAAPSASASTSTAKRTKPASLSFLPPPLALPPDDRLRVLLACPLCPSAWPSTKSLSVRQTHLRQCATKQLHTAEAVALLTDEAVLRLADAAEERRREREESLSLFDRVVGRGEGSHPWREVKVVGVEVGVEGGAAGGAGELSGSEFFHRTQRVQEEMDGLRKKIAQEKVVKVAKEIRRERAAAEEAGRVKVEGEERGADQLPPSTGRLRPDDDAARAAVAARASEVLGFAGGTGLTQLPLLAAGAGGEAMDVYAAAAEAEEGGEAWEEPPRPTQGFEESELAGLCESGGRAEVVRLSSRSSFRADPAGEDSDDDLVFGSPAPPRRKSGGGESLWRTAAGRDEDDEMVGRVVPSPPSPASPFSYSLPPSSPSPAHHRRSRSTPLAAALSPSATIGLSPSSHHQFSTLALSSPATVTSLRSRPPSPVSPSPARIAARAAAHPYSLTHRSLFRHRSASPLSSPSRSYARLSSRGRRSPSPDSPPPPAQEGRTGRLGLSEHRADDGEVGEVEMALDAGEEEGWMMQGGASPGGLAAAAGGAESSEDEPLAVTTSAARRKAASKGRAREAEEPSSPTPARRRPARPADEDDEGEDEEHFHFVGDDDAPSGAAPPPKVKKARATKSKSTAAVASSKPTASPSAAVSKPKSKSKAKAKAKTKSMPDYSLLSLAVLQKEVGKYGLRPSKERGVMEEQLGRVWRALNPSPAEEEDVAGPAPTPVKRGRKKKVVEEGEGEGEATPPKKPTKGRKKKAAAAAEDEPVEEEFDTRTVGEKLRELIVANVELYCRILRYEPIHLDEFTNLAKSGGVKVAQTLLMRCLDEQSITFYTQDPTNGSRRRYK